MTCRTKVYIVLAEHTESIFIIRHEFLKGTFP